MIEQRPLSASHRGEGPFLRRFSRLQVILHALVVVSFLGLVMTGAPLHFSHAAWGRGLIGLLGGVESAGLIHRVCAVITFGYFFTHVGHITVRLLKDPDKKAILWGPASMVPQPKDVRDVIQQFQWFLGRSPRPKFDRYSYMEKFDYWAVFWGVAIIGGSGLLLWFPEFFSDFLPGWWFNIATIVHGEEALLALGFIFTVHFFNVHLRPEKFPIDVVIFTGRATADYMKEEHPLEYERLMREGRLEELKASRPSRTHYVWAIGAGFAALALGIGLIVLVLWAVVAS